MPVPSFPTTLAILICAGGPTFAPRGLALTRHLRSFHGLTAAVPIVVAHAGPEELPPSFAAAFHELGNVSTWDVASSLDVPPATLRNFFIKPLALATLLEAPSTRLRRVLLVDADAVFLHDPSPLLLNEGINNKSLFFYDFATMWRPVGSRASPSTFLPRFAASFDATPFDGPDSEGTNVLTRRRDALNARDIVQTPLLTRHEQDSSVVLWDAHGRRGAAATAILRALNTEPLRRQLAEHTWGDKESFWLAAVLADAPFAFSPHATALVGTRHRHGAVCQVTGAGQAQHVPWVDDVDDEQSTRQRRRLLYINSKYLEDSSVTTWHVGEVPETELHGEVEFAIDAKDGRQKQQPPPSSRPRPRRPDMSSGCMRHSRPFIPDSRAALEAYVDMLRDARDKWTECCSDS